MTLYPMKNLAGICFILVLFAGCKKDEEIIKGSITGMVLYVDQYHSENSLYTRVGLADAVVSLYSDSTFLNTTLSDQNGNYTFTNVPYGKYDIRLQKQGFVTYQPSYLLYHAGGDCPTISDVLMEEIPTFQLTIDSAKFYDGFDFIMYLKLDGKPNFPVLSFGGPVMVYASDSPDVTNENYKSKGVADMFDIKSWFPFELCPLYAETMATTWYGMDNNFYGMSKDMIYVRIYPAPYSQIEFGYYNINPAFLGKPSNVIKLVNN
jgi:hypothetical protein